MKLRIAFLTPSLHHGGAERWILSLARHFRRARAVGCLLLSDHYHAAVLAEAERLMPVAQCRESPASRRHVREARELLGQLSREADCLVAWGIPGLKRLCRDAGLPVVDVSHASGAWPAQRRLCAAAWAGADYLAAVSRTAAGAYPPAMQAAVQVIYNGVEADRIAPRTPRSVVRQRLGATPGERVLLYLGRFSPEKRPGCMLDALRHLPNSWRTWFVGHGPCEAELRRRAEEEHPGRCLFLGPRTQVGDLLAAADCLLLPSRYEGMPLVLLEAWLAGLPTVAARFEFIEEIEALHGKLCESVPLEEPGGEALAAAVRRAAAGGGAAAAREIVWRHYTAGAMAQRWEEYLAEVASHWNGRHGAA